MLLPVVHVQPLLDSASLLLLRLLLLLLVQPLL
jgi:hypothetical protein